MGGERKKRPYHIERESSEGVWTRWNDLEYDGTQEALTALKQAQQSGKFRIICLCSTLDIKAEPIVKLHISEV